MNTQALWQGINFGTQNRSMSFRSCCIADLETKSDFTWPMSYGKCLGGWRATFSMRILNPVMHRTFCAHYRDLASISNANIRPIHDKNSKVHSCLQAKSRYEYIAWTEKQSFCGNTTWEPFKDPQDVLLARKRIRLGQKLVDLELGTVWLCTEMSTITG